jgi:hypothetical protein
MPLLRHRVWLPRREDATQGPASEMDRQRQPLAQPCKAISAGLGSCRATAFINRRRGGRGWAKKLRLALWRGVANGTALLPATAAPTILRAELAAWKGLRALSVCEMAAWERAWGTQNAQAAGSRRRSPRSVLRCVGLGLRLFHRDRTRAAGQTNGQDILTTNSAVGIFGTYDFQRRNGHFYQAYRDASNYAVGVYMAGAGYSYSETLAAGTYYSLRHSSNWDSGFAYHIKWWTKGWTDATDDSWPVSHP